MGELDSPEESCADEKRTSEDGEGFKGLKHSLGTMDGAKANVFNSITRPFAVQMGKQHGLAVKKLVERSEESVFEQPPHLGVGKGEELALWEMEIKETQRKKAECNDEKGKVFSCILQKCDDTVIARLESMEKHEAAESDGDVVAKETGGWNW